MLTGLFANRLGTLCVYGEGERQALVTATASASTTQRFDPRIAYGWSPVVIGRSGWRLHSKDPVKSSTRGKPSIRRVKEVIAERTPVMQLGVTVLSGVTPLMKYIDEVDKQRPTDTITVVLPEYIARHWWEHALHNQTALQLKAALLFRPGTVVTYHLERSSARRGR